MRLHLHLADAFIHRDLQSIQAIRFFVSMCVPWDLNPQPFALLTQCSTTEPQMFLCLFLCAIKLVLTCFSFYFRPDGTERRESRTE